GACDIGVTRGVHSDASGAFVTPTPTKIAGVDEHGVNDQRLGPIIGGDVKAHPTRAFQNVATRDFAAGAIDLLVDDGLQLPDHAGARVKDEVALGINFQFVGALDVERDRL